MMTMRQIASGDDGDDDEGQDQDHGHDERGAMRKIQPNPRATTESGGEWQSEEIDGRSSKRE